MSRMRSVSSVTLSVSYNEDVERVEAIILKEIEEIKEKVPNITEGPWYKGIDSISASSINFLVLCYVDESNRFQVTRDMNREFYLAFKKNNVQIPYTQVTVNGEDEKKTAKASPEEVALAVREQKILRGTIDKEPKKKASKKARVIKKIQQSYEQAQKDMD
jgi:small conductance mechanosensitive channel